MSPVPRPLRRRTSSVACAWLLLAAAAGGCGGPPAARDDASSTPSVAAPADSGAATPDTSRDGTAFVAIYRGGPYDELRVVRATDGALVIGGSTRFPDGTRIAVSLMRQGPRGAEAATTSRATVELGRFMSGPLVPSSGPVAQGIHAIRLTVPFGANDQAAEVLRAADDGRRFEGPGTRTAPDGRIVHELTLEAPL